MEGTSFDWGALGGFVKDTAAAAASVSDVFDKGKREDLKKAQDASKFNWQTVALALGGVLAAALVLKFAFRR